MSRRLLLVHAHPDDEASKGAATAARYVDEGAAVVLVTCTDGGAGELLNPAVDPADVEDLVAVRARELAAAVAAIGFSRAHGLGFADSGYHLEPADVPGGTFARAQLDAAAAALATILRTERPHVVVTYPEDGGYPHPDHVMTHLVTMRALELARDAEATGVAGPPWPVAKVYAVTGFPRERLVAIDAELARRGEPARFAEWLAELPATLPGPDARIAVAGHLERRDAALRAHVTQVDPEGDWFAVPREVELAAYPFEAFTLLDSAVPTVLPESDLFAGLDADGWDEAVAVGSATVPSR